ncbi:hypothetical protein [Cerasicoccus frondis]|uniref:hypothetical protein n=1 Tax=Cerasicoccus frondis TaxID=490090 RepID=UPI0028529D06|nr:hypothetical protein [Cerasicoccus frondis]
MSILGLVENFNASYYRKLNLVASENITSAAVRYALQSDFGHRYGMPEKKDPAVWDYPDQDSIRAITRKAENLACGLFHAVAADVNPLSGNQVAMIMLTSLLQEGDSFLSVPADCGGHFATEKIAVERGYSRLDIPYRDGRLDVEQTANLVRQHQAKLIFLDASMVLFPYPLRELRVAVGDDVIISYDGSHTMGIIAGGQFQSPIEEGADFFHGSTHKSFWGPQKAIITSAHSPDEYAPAKAVFSRVMPLFVSNAHPHHIAALGIALEESQKFGREYADHVVKNARTLAHSLSNRGLKPLFEGQGFTQCHQIIVPIGNRGQAEEAFRRLEAANINVNAIHTPFRDEYGLRIGLSELTRRGIVNGEMQATGELIADAVLAQRAVEDIRRDVAELSGSHQTIYYCNIG